jgi:predicted PilT family ATPase
MFKLGLSVPIAHTAHVQADETTEVIKIPNKFHSGLIGTAGKYVNRLEEKYMVKINFGGEDSRAGRGREAANLGPDEVMIKGGKKGVAGARNELVEVSSPSLNPLFGST